MVSNELLVLFCFPRGINVPQLTRITCCCCGAPMTGLEAMPEPLPASAATRKARRRCCTGRAAAARCCWIGRATAREAAGVAAAAAARDTDIAADVLVVGGVSVGCGQRPKAHARAGEGSDPPMAARGGASSAEESCCARVCALHSEDRSVQASHIRFKPNS